MDGVGVLAVLPLERGHGTVDGGSDLTLVEH